ncbi:helicase-related protein [Robiginitomaculum antarcticum]|uniref:helicase-related protein n=1 Tax=Robiginitomaculum antarcticum TaxID=437507 RepID=UPI0003624266|nr:helicase-related protein [Robiginitomaculum antarcticum]
MSGYRPDPVVTAILGPTNTGKTHYAIERMLARRSGVIGLPLRLLAREVYDRIIKLKDARLCALITGEEKIIPPGAQYFVCTVEAMPQDREFAFVAIDEVQLCAHKERGHIFTDRLLHMRGTEETLFLGAETLRPIIRDLVPKARHETRERFSTLSYAGATKMSRLPKRSVIVAFTAAEVYSLAELMRRHRGGAAVVMGALSPRTRNAQAALYQSGEVDFLIATDAVGMGLNLDADHVAFASMRKFDGNRRRYLSSDEAAQIAGRAGRFRNAGTFGTTANCLPMDDDMVGRIENHLFDPLRYVEWRNNNLDMSSVERLMFTLNKPPERRRLRRVKNISDEIALDRFVENQALISGVNSAWDVARLWEVCQIPDFRNLSMDSHFRLLSDIYLHLRDNGGRLPEDWLEKHVKRLDHIDGSIDTLSSRLANIRTWTYVTNKAAWLSDAKHWISRTRMIEDRLSDALHERLLQKFVDRRTQALLKGLGSKTVMDIKISSSGEVTAGGHFVGRLDGLEFSIDTQASGLEAKALRETAETSIAPEIDRRITSMVGAQHDVFRLGADGIIYWGEHKIARLSAGATVLKPTIKVIGGELAQPVLTEHLEGRLNDFIQADIRNKLAALKNLDAVSTNQDIAGEARGFAFRLLENDGVMPRRGNEAVINDVKGAARADLRSAGVRFGEYFVYLYDLIKPAAGTLLTTLYAYSEKGDGKPFVPFAGVTSTPMEAGYSEASLNRAGYSGQGSRIVRVDILNRVGQTIRQAQTESGSARFQIALEMLALLGSSYEECQDVLRALGYKSTKAKSEDIMADKKPAADVAAKTADKSDGADKDPTSPAAESHEDTLDDPTKPAAQSYDAAQAGDKPAQAVKLNTLGKDGKPKHNMPSAPAAKARPKKSRSKTPAALSYFQPVTGQDEDGNDIRGHQDEVWYPQRRNSGGGSARPAQDRPPRNKNGFKGKPRDNKTDAKRGKEAPRGNKNNNRGASKPSKANYEDSPFAALMALKNPEKKKD